MLFVLGYMIQKAVLLSMKLTHSKALPSGSTVIGYPLLASNIINIICILGLKDIRKWKLHAFQKIYLHLFWTQ